MVAKPNGSVYKSVVEVTHVYLGPAAERFIARQVENHLHKDPRQLSRADLAKLIDWIRVVVSLLTEDDEIIEEYVGELKKLTIPDTGRDKKTGKARHGSI